MPPLSNEQKIRLGPCFKAFEMNDEKKAKGYRPGDGEIEREFIQHLIHDAVDDGRPTESYVEVSKEEVDTVIKLDGRLPEKSFLWIIDEYSIKIVREKTRNPGRTSKPDFVCHTNLTGDGVARAGGEMYFGDDGKIYVNPFSDRYGRKGASWDTVLEYFRSVWEEEVVDILELMDSNK